MRTIFKIIGLGAILLLVQACIELNDELDSLTYIPKTVIEGLIVDSKGQSFVKLSVSAPNGDEIYNYPVNDARVVITENDSATWEFRSIQAGLYTDSLFCGKINSTYHLRVQYDGKEYFADSKLLPVSKVDSMVFERTDSISATDQEYKVFIYANRTSPDFTSYYKVKVSLNDSLFNAYSDMLLIDDLLFNSFQKIEMPYTFHSSDKVKIEIYSLTHDAYNYFEELSGLTNNNLNSLYFYPQNPKTNLSGDALGIFQVSSFSSKEIILP